MKITIIGSGNAAAGLGKALFEAGHRIMEVCGRNNKTVRSLAKSLAAKPVSDPSKISDETDLVLVAVSDDAIKKTIAQMKPGRYIVVHTSGQTSIDLFKKKFSEYGVFYPVMSITRSKENNFSSVPLCLEAGSKKTFTILKKLAHSIGGKVYSLDSGERRQLHLAAVFANNFTNHLYAVAASILEKNKLPADLLYPLIISTAEKIKSGSPSVNQTGPAKRKDFRTIRQHLEMLKKDPSAQRIYRILTRAIMES